MSEVVNETKKTFMPFFYRVKACNASTSRHSKKIDIYFSSPVSFVSVSLSVSACMSSALLLCQQFNYVVDVLLARSSPLLQLAEH